MELADVLGALLFWDSHTCKLPLLRCISPSPDDLQNLPKSVQQLGTVLVDLVGCFGVLLGPGVDLDLAFCTTI